MAAPNLKEIEWAIEELKHSESSKSNYIFMASLLRCRDELMGKEPEQEISAYSRASGPVVASYPLDTYGDSDFLLIVSGKLPEDAWAVMDDLMDTLRVANPRVYESVMRKLRQL